MEILKQYHEEIIAETSTLRFSDELSLLEVFSRKLAVEIERILANQDFFIMVFKDFPPNENDHIVELFQELQASTVAFHKKSIVEAFGTKVEPFLADLATVLGGMLREYLITLIFENKQASPEKLSAFITGSMNAIVQQLDKLTPVLAEEPTFHELREESLRGIEAKIHTSIRGKEKLLSTLQLLKTELDKTEPQAFLIEALLVYLKQEEQLENEIVRLEKYI